jgi:hypothetical protein
MISNCLYIIIKTCKSIYKLHFISDAQHLKNLWTKHIKLYNVNFRAQKNHLGDSRMVFRVVLVVVSGYQDALVFGFQQGVAG